MPILMADGALFVCEWRGHLDCHWPELTHMPYPSTPLANSYFVDQMPTGDSATVIGLTDSLRAGAQSGVVTRLAELGFLPGEQVTVLRRGPGGREPIAVQIGETVFALRGVEASCIEVNHQMGAQVQ